MSDTIKELLDEFTKQTGEKILIFHNLETNRTASGEHIPKSVLKKKDIQFYAWSRSYVLHTDYDGTYGETWLCWISRKPPPIGRNLISCVHAGF